jgi:hypothetical protein
MKITNLSTTDQDALQRTLNYWISHWDWECPTLFGLEQSDFQALVSTWPQCLVLQEETAALAIIGGLREILHGASAVKGESIDQFIGICYSEACQLLNRLLPKSSLLAAQTMSLNAPNKKI